MSVRDVPLRQFAKDLSIFVERVWTAAFGGPDRLPANQPRIHAALMHLGALFPLSSYTYVYTYVRIRFKMLGM